MPTGTGANDLTRLCGVDDVEEDEPYRAEIDGIGYAVFFFENEYFVLEDLCSHGPGRLSDGFVEDFEVECPFHQGRFDIRNGLPTEAPCEIPVRIWTPIIQNNDIFIDIANPASLRDMDS